MKIAIVGSRTIKKINNLAAYLPENVEAIISGGAVGVDQIAAAFAAEHQIPLVEFLPQYEKFGRQAPLVRNVEIIKNSSLVLAFWNGHSRGTAFVVRKCRELGVPVRLFRAV